MAGYTRTGVGVEDNIADGLTINAADFNAEYNAIEVAFGTSGHTHDGTAGNGPAITAVGPSLAYEFNANAMQPKSGQTSLDLGTTGLRFDNAFFTTTNTNNLTVNTSTTLTGTVNIGSVSLEEYIEDITGGNLTAGTGIAVAYNDTAGTGTVSLSHLGLQSLTDPNADRIAFWDDSGGSFNWLGLGGGLSISGTNLVVSDATTSASGFMSAADKTKLNGVETGATADQTAAEIRTLVEAATNSNVFTDADHTKLDGIEANATADQTASEIRTLVEAASDSNVFTDADHSKLNGIEAGATGDQTNDEIRAAVEAATNSNVFTDADHTKLNGIETNATADQTGAQIKAAYEGESNTNAFTDAEKTKLSNIETSADVTDTTNVTAAGALMDSELASEASVKAINQQLTTTSSPSFTAVSTDTISEVTSANGVSIDSAKLKDGNFVPAAAKGVEYANSYSSVTGVTGNSKLLDWYEEGDFTPFIEINGSTTGITYNWNTGSYTRIGNLVHIAAEINLSDKGSLNGQVTMKGLPFGGASVGSGSTNLAGVGSLHVLTGIGTSSANNGFVRIAGSTAEIYVIAGTAASYLQAAQITDSFRFNVGMTYFVG